MNTWNYRVVRRVRGDEEEYQIHEIYYDESNAITGWSQNAIAPCGYDQGELIADMKLMLAAAEKPVLDHADLPGSS